MNFKGKKALVTGGSAGIGKELIRQLIDLGIKDFAVIGRSQKKLDALEREFQEVNFILVAGDVSKLEDLERLVAEVSSQWNGIDLLINNAGVLSAAPLQKLSDEDIINQININLTGVILLTKKALPLLKNCEKAAIMNISSGLGLIAKPFYSVYAATKAGLKHFSESMRRELIFEKIHVMTVYPTATDTNMLKGVHMEHLDSVELVAKRAIEGLLQNDIDVILGGEKRLRDVEINKNRPLEIDKHVKDNYDAYKKRAKNHRAM